MSKLPDKPSELIRISLEDLEKCEKSEKYKINMDDWHVPHYEASGPCSVCLAGAVMAQTFDAPRDKYVGPSHLSSSEDKFKLYALNCFRRGKIKEGLKELFLSHIHGDSFNRQIIEYAEDSDLFKKEMGDLANDLEKKEL